MFREKSLFFKKTQSVIFFLENKLKMKTNSLFVMREIENKSDRCCTTSDLQFKVAAVSKIGSKAMNENGNWIVRKDIQPFWPAKCVEEISCK